MPGVAAPTDRLAVFIEDALRKLDAANRRVPMPADVLDAFALVRRELAHREEVAEVEKTARALVEPQGRRLRVLEARVRELEVQLAEECERSADLADERERYRVELEEALMRLRKTPKPPAPPSRLDGFGLDDPDETVSP